MKKRNGEIDLLKFLFSVLIVVFHSKNFVNAGSEKIFTGGAIGVAFFFIVSGYLMVHSAMKINSDSTGEVGQLTVKFIWKKIRGLMPDVYVAWVIAFVVESFIVRNTEVFAALRKACYGIFELLFLNMAGFLGGDVFRVNHVTWYLSAMLIVMAIYYPILLRYKKNFLTLAAPLIVLFLYGYVYTNIESGFSTPSASVGFIRKGLLRAFAEIALGCACYLPAQKLKNLKTTGVFKTAMAVIAFGCYGIVFWQSYDRISTLLYIMMAFVLAVGVVISFSEQTIWHDWLNHPVISWLGAFSFDLYISHGFWSHAMKKILPDTSYTNRLAVYLVIVAATALVVKYVSALILKIWPVFMNWFRRTMFRQA